MTESNIGDAAVGPGTENLPSSPHLFLTILPEQQDSNGCCTAAFTVTCGALLVDIIVLAAIRQRCSEPVEEKFS